ncbi:MAG: efflux RND transporter periplasmic adaptor subunit [Paludibacter sp.]|nr:efflux RND transporter periplasmic adaptor subunit [Paludibacter sp.]
MKRTIIILVVVALLVLVGFRLSKNYAEINANSNVSTDLNYTSVSVAPVEQMVLDRSIQLVGYLNPNKEINIAAESQGQLTSLNLELGQQVSKGSVLGTIDSKQKQLTLEATKISVAKLEKDLNRYKILYAGGTLTEQQLEEMQNAFDNAVILFKQAQKQLDDATIKSPLTGIITQKFVEQGSFINMGSPIATIVDISSLKIKLNVSESNVYELKKGDLAKITTDVYPNNTFEAKISFISPKGDAAHNYEVELEIKNNHDHPLKAGTYVNVNIKIQADKQALYIPRTALMGGMSNASVYLAQGNKAVLRKINVRTGDDKYLEVVSGLSNDDKVITAGQVNLSDGKTIKATTK